MSLGAFAKLIGVEGGAEALSVIFSRWEEVVGKAVAEHAEPRRLRDGTLTVVVDHSAWATQLRLLAPQLIEKLNSTTGATAVTSIDVTLRSRRRQR